MDLPTFVTEDGLYTFYASLDEAGFDDPLQYERDGMKPGPEFILADGTETVFLADMSGDGLSDIVRVRNGATCYWPNEGYGNFGPKVTMDRRRAFAMRSGTTNVAYGSPTWTERAPRTSCISAAMVSHLF